MKLIKRFNNPILFKELRQRMRSHKAVLDLVLYLSVLGGMVLTFIYLMTGNQSYFNPWQTREIFLMLTIFQFAMISFVTPGLTAGMISGERERQTLNLLLTTNSSATKIIIGKWLSSLSFMVFLVLSSIPLYAIVFLYGGISPAQLVKVFAFYLVSMLALGSFGIMFSSIFKRTGVATVMTYGVIFTYTALTLIGAQLLQTWHYQQLHQAGGGTSASGHRITLWIDFLYSINPITATFHIFNQGPVSHYSPSAGQASLPLDPYWIYFLFFGSITLIALCLAVYFLKPVRPRLIRLGFRRKEA